MNVVKASLLLFVAVLAQVSILGGYSPLGGSADLLLVVMVSIALLRGSVFGAVAGFGAGLLLDIANLSTLGFTSLLLTIAGFWIGRYGETTARDRFHAPYLSVLVVTVLYAFCALVLRFVLGEPVPAHAVLAGVPAEVLWNLILTWPVYGVVRRLFPPIGASARTFDVHLLSSG
jgi:rod shape-determining protein MreD